MFSFGNESENYIVSAALRIDDSHQRLGRDCLELTCEYLWCDRDADAVRRAGDGLAPKSTRRPTAPEHVYAGS